MSDASKPEGRFMVAVGAVIEHVGSGRILLLRRAPTADYLPGIWEDPMGRIKQFEEPEEALRREIMEECGLQVEIVKPIAVFHDYRGEETPENEWIGITYRCKTLSERVVLSDEHDAHQWLLPAQALDLAEHVGVRRDIEAFIEEIG
jgi:8-oxo-dGTP diphosphatase